MERGSVTEYPDWANLPLVPLHLISEKLKYITDYIRFRAVCSPWRLASHPKPHHLPVQLPWLVIPNYDPYQTVADRTDDGMRLFYDLWESKMHKIHIPETAGKSCCASYCGWLLLVAKKGKELFLLNPLTRARVDLPPFIDSATSTVRRFWAMEHLFQSAKGNYVITKMTFSSDLADPNCLIMVLFERARRISFCRVGDRRWTAVVLPSRPDGMPDGMSTDAAYHNGRFYLMDGKVISIYDLNKNNEQRLYHLEPEVRGKKMSFLVGKYGLYLVVARYVGEEIELENVVQSTPNQRIFMYKFQYSNQREVQRVTDTSDTAVFYGENDHYLAVCADEWDSLDGDSMYIAYMYRNDSSFNGNEDCHKVLVAKLNDGKSHMVGFSKTLRHRNPEPAMWFQPSFV